MLLTFNSIKIAVNSKAFPTKDRLIRLHSTVLLIFLTTVNSIIAVISKLVAVNSCFGVLALL